MPEKAQSSVLTEIFHGVPKMFCTKLGPTRHYIQTNWGRLPHRSSLPLPPVTARCREQQQNRLAPLYQDKPVEPALELSGTLTQHTVPLSLASNSSQAPPAFPPRPPSLPLGSNTKKNLGKQLK